MFCTLLLIVFTFVNAHENLDSYLYILKRNQLKQNFDRILMNKTIEENIVGFYFDFLKNKELKYENKYFYYPIESNIELIQKNSSLYKFLRNMPKGANLHLQEFQELDRSKVLDLLSESLDYNNLYICDQINSAYCKNTKYFMNYFRNKKSVPKGWTKLSETKLTKQEIIEKTTLIGLLKGLKLSSYVEYFSEIRMNLTSDTKLSLIFKNVTEYKSTYFEYLKVLLDSALDENVQILELRRQNFGTLWSYNANGNKEYTPAFEELEELKKFKHEYIQKNPNFIDFSFIVVGQRSLPDFELDSVVESSIRYNKRYPDLVSGFDLVQEDDDTKQSLLNHRESLIKAQSYGKNESNDSFQLYVHESDKNLDDNKPIYHTKNDDTITENIYDAIILQINRLGNGLGYIKHPRLYEILIKNDIAIELSVVNNQLLGYTPDIRNHPGNIKH